MKREQRAWREGRAGHVIKWQKKVISVLEIDKYIKLHIGYITTNPSERVFLGINLQQLA